jgi:HSP20 family protein
MREDTTTKPGLIRGLRERIRNSKYNSPSITPESNTNGTRRPSWDMLRAMVRGAVSRRMWSPMFDIREDGTAIKLIADLPGVNKDDIVINVAGNTLTVSGKREADQRTKNERVHMAERAFGKFTRSFALPDRSDVERITTNLGDGVLTIFVPKVDQGRRIVID